MAAVRRKIVVRFGTAYHLRKAFVPSSPQIFDSNISAEQNGQGKPMILGFSSQFLIILAV